MKYKVVRGVGKHGEKYYYCVKPSWDGYLYDNPSWYFDDWEPKCSQQYALMDNDLWNGVFGFKLKPGEWMIVEIKECKR